MEKNEIKKELYKQDPLANFNYIKKSVAHYYVIMLDKTMVYFAIPVEDMGDAEFRDTMPAKLLIRYIV